LEPNPIKLKLERIKLFLKLIGDPQEKVKYKVHIAGTNGKGSTLSFLENLLLEETSLKIGKYTSPHLVSVRERFQISKKKEKTNISFRKLKELFRRFSDPDFDYCKNFRNLSVFEKLTVISFAYFFEEKVDLILLETGLGGRLDATNVIKKVDLCLFTNISLDHVEYLGQEKKQIAFEKAGILKPEGSWISTVEYPENLIIKKLAQAKNAQEVKLKELEQFKLNSREFISIGLYQKRNAQLALNAFDFLIKKVLDQKYLKNPSNNYSPDFIKIKQRIWPGRFQDITKYFSLGETKKIILDGAHNQDSAKKLRESLDQKFTQKNNKELFLIGFSRKDYLKQNAILSELIKINQSEIIVTELNYSKKIFAKELLATKFNVLYLPKFEQAFQEFKSKVKVLKFSSGVITGSLYLVGKVLSSFVNQKLAPFEFSEEPG